MELPEHGSENGELNITNDDPIIVGKMVLAHLRMAPDFYTRVGEMMNTVDEETQVE